MNDRTFPLGVSEFTTCRWTFEQDVDVYARHGIDAIEVTEFELDAARATERLALVETHGLTVSSGQATVHGAFPTKLQPEPVAPAERLRHLRASVERIAPQVPAGTTGGRSPRRFSRSGRISMGTGPRCWSNAARKALGSTR